MNCETIKAICGITFLLTLAVLIISSAVTYGVEDQERFKRMQKATLQSIVLPVDETSYATEEDFPVLHPGEL